ncbi:Aerobactin synthase [Paraconexibacter sp. AEG42_29]|uniref:Aerobactin synthase n=1 Tax=Paraconexibacter sp. AEG42_29 TaxID=2997339 RepID=A0AAU7B2L7_9ACTN
MSARTLDALTSDGGAAYAQAGRELLAKLIGELTFEDVLTPAILSDPDADLPGPDAAVLELALGDLIVSGRARRRSLGHWRVAPASLTARDAATGAARPLPDPALVVALGAPAAGADASTTAGLVAEVAATVLSDAVQLHRGRPARELLDAAPIDVEAELRGHPWIVAAKGRIGFDSGDLDHYAPEAQRTLQLDWLAVAADRIDTRALPGLTHRQVVDEQLGAQEADRLRARAAAAGHDPDTTVLLPVHPWQWRERILALHAADLASGAITHLGTAAPTYRARQSIRTLVDAGPDGELRRELKLPLSILNTSVYRGLPRARALAAPVLTEWLVGCVDRDPFLQETGLVLLGEVASASVAHTAFGTIEGVPYQHTEMLGAIWREPVAAQLHEGERALPLAALFHVDPAGESLIEHLIARSGLTVDAWVRALHEVSLPPLCHVLYRYGATFSPHGQNTLVVLRDDVPTRIVVKDFVDDATICAEPLPELLDLSPAVRAALGDGVEPAVITQWIQAGLLVCAHRYIAELLADRCGYPEAAFWAAARAALHGYQDRFEDELGPRFDLFDLDAPVFVKLCLNRVRILERGYRDGAERPIAAASGWIDNPLHAPAPAPVTT